MKKFNQRNRGDLKSNQRGGSNDDHIRVQLLAHNHSKKRVQTVHHSLHSRSSASSGPFRPSLGTNSWSSESTGADKDQKYEDQRHVWMYRDSDRFIQIFTPPSAATKKLEQTPAAEHFNRSRPFDGFKDVQKAKGDHKMAKPDT